jgi:hypothetical protein
MDFKAIVLSIVLSAAFTLIISYAYFNPKIAYLQQHAESTPPIIIIDRARLALQAVPLGTEQKTIEEHFKNVNSLIDKFKKAGFVVLSSTAVLASPEEVNLTVTDITENKHLPVDPDE